MLKEALQKLQAEIVAEPKKPYLAPIGSFMMDRVRNHPDDADKVMVNGKTLTGAIAAMKAEAQKNQADGCGYLTDEQGFAIVLKYYGIAVPEPVPATVVARGISVSLDDLL